MAAEVGEGSAEVAECHATMGMIHHYLGNTQNAGESYEASAEIFKSLEDEEREAAVKQRLEQLLGA